METLSYIGYPGSTFRTIRIQTAPNVSIQVNESLPAEDTGRMPILFVSGLATIMESFGHIIHNFTRDFPFYFIETREHPSSRVGENEKFDIEFLKKIVNWYLRNFVINKKGDPEMVKISATAINNCDQTKLKKTAIGIAPYQGWDKPEKIDRPVLIIAASLDTMHMHEETMRLKSLIRDCRYEDMVTNEKSHSDEAAVLMRKFITAI